MNSPLGSLAHISHFLQQPGDFGHLAKSRPSRRARMCTQCSTAVDFSFEDILKIFEAGFEIVLFVFNILRRSMPWPVKSLGQKNAMCKSRAWCSSARRDPSRSMSKELRCAEDIHLLTKSQWVIRCDSGLLWVMGRT